MSFKAGSFEMTMVSLDEFLHFKLDRISNMNIMSYEPLNIDNSMVYCSRHISPEGFLKFIPCNSPYPIKENYEIAN